MLLNIYVVQVLVFAFANHVGSLRCTVNVRVYVYVLLMYRYMVSAQYAAH